PFLTTAGCMNLMIPGLQQIYGTQIVTIVRRRPIPRKGHRKSRAGCIVCKKRKVKCDESLPRCGQCLRLGLTCQYTTAPASSSQVVGVPREVVQRQIHTDAPTFGIDDLKFFQNFLFHAYPPLPIEGWDVWQHIGQMSHGYVFLAHSMLGLGASHLAVLSGADYEQAALRHRVTAMTALNEHMKKPNYSKADADAAFAAMLNLTFQAAYMADGLTDFLTLVRGCFVVGNTLLPNFEDSAFKTFARAAYVEQVRKLIGNSGEAESLDATVAEEFCNSLKQLAPICRSVPELEYLAMMQRIANFAVTNPAESYHEHSFLYERLGELSMEEFSSFMNPQNHASRLIIMHMLTLDFVMSRKDVQDGSRLGSSEAYRKGYDCRKNMSVAWISQMLGELPKDYQVYAEWIQRFSQGLTFSFDSDDEIWKPFLLHHGKANLPSSQYHGSVQQVES
ncbi:unnamed protein product, partial [Clonostachys rosea]